MSIVDDTVCPGCGVYPRLAPDAYCACCADMQDADSAELRDDEPRPKRIIDRERQWRRLDRGHYVSPRGRFHAVREPDGWLLVDQQGEIEPAWYGRWRDARPYVESIEFGDTAGAPAPIELAEETIDSGAGPVHRIRVTRAAERLAEIVVRRGGDEIEPYLPGPMTPDLTEAVATALMLATHRAAAMRKED